MTRRTPLLLTVTATLLASPLTSTAADLFREGVWPALASDRPAARPGDTLTVIIDEYTTASNSAKNGTKKSSFFGFQLSGLFNNSQSLNLNSGFDASGQTQRVHKMIGQISVVVDQVLPNGYLHVAGAESLKINGERTNIYLKGDVRPADIQGDNTVLSTRLADATINYDGVGFDAQNLKPGVLNRVFNWLGLP
jgi:flagellar L-ring protein FlgH